LATLLREREYTAATILNSLPPMSNPIAVAETAGMVARRRRVGKVVVFLTGAALAATIFISIPATNIGRMMFGLSSGAPALETETVPLTCLSPEQAGHLVEPYLDTPGSTYSVASASEGRIPAITIRGTPRQLAKAVTLVQVVDGNPRSTCHATRAADIVNEIVKQFGGTPPAAAAIQPSPAPTVKVPTTPRK
jgi:hypothetical protein